MNCTELESSKRIFSPMCKVFNSEYADDSVLLAKKTLQALIAGRPTDASELKTIMQQIIDNNDDNVDQTEDSNVSEVQDDDWFLSSKASTIKDASPFTQLFLNIELESMKGLGNTLNLLFNQDYITFIQYHFMPYIFIWSGFVYRQMDGANITRLSQGVIEKCFATKRRTIPKPIVPARHIQASLKDDCDCVINRKINDLEEKSNQKGI